MVLIKGRAGSGKTTELVRRFYESGNSIFSSDEVSQYEILKIAQHNKFKPTNGNRNIYKSINNEQELFSLSEYAFNMGYNTIFLEIHQSWFLSNIKDYIQKIKNIENQTGQEFVLSLYLNRLTTEKGLLIETV